MHEKETTASYNNSLHSYIKCLRRIPLKVQAKNAKINY